jgi:hypothetical protein
MINMRTAHDCGPAAISNLLEVAAGIPAASTYDRILREHGFPNVNGLRDDLWDSPARHVEVARAVSGLEVGVSSGPGTPAAVLLHLGGVKFHWVVRISRSDASSVWHIGTGLVVQAGNDPPAGRVVFSYKVGSSKRPALYWRAWRALTDLAV